MQLGDLLEWVVCARKYLFYSDHHIIQLHFLSIACYNRSHLLENLEFEVQCHNLKMFSEELINLKRKIDLQHSYRCHGENKTVENRWKG